MLKLYIAVLDEFPDYMTPTLVAHSMLSAHLKFDGMPNYEDWLNNSFRKVVVRVDWREFDKIKQLPYIHIGREYNTLDGRESCIVVFPCSGDTVPNVLKFAKLWKPKNDSKQDSSV